jgi:hypothetical protein
MGIVGGLKDGGASENNLLIASGGRKDRKDHVAALGKEERTF